MGRKRFTVKVSGKTKKVTVKVSAKGKRYMKRYLRHHKRLRIRAILKAKPTGKRAKGAKAGRTMRASKTLTIKKGKGKK